ncbi:MAG: 50S ribosomal protein L10 [Proteobacteria bacterium]|nr:50S ribosomal protein L10 [Pseudomonadota bacterium]
MNRTQKEELVIELKDRMEKSALVVVTRQSGLTVSEVTNLRCQMRNAGAEFKVYKNTLTEIAIKGTDAEGLSSYLTGPIALAFSVDALAAAKAAVKFANSNDKLQVLGGVMNGKVLSAADVKALATLPSLDELRATLIGLISAPATKIARILIEPASRVARVIGAKANA